MDPDATLTKIRELVSMLVDHPGEPTRELAELAEALDEWLSRGGFLPEAWQTSSRK